MDKWCNDNNITKIDLIKIDVEGFEMNVLKGGIQTLQKFKPKMFIELDDNNLKDVGSSAKELINFIAKLDYKIINAEDETPITADTDFTNCHYDIICLPKS